MASLTHDSELMTQHVAAIAVPNSSRFVTVNDEVGKPMVFSLGTDQKVHLIKTNSIGDRILIDFGALLRLANDYKVYAFDVVQNVDSTLYIVLATEDPSGWTGGDFIVLSPFKPADYNLGEYSTDLRLLMMPENGTHKKTSISTIYMSNSNNGQHYPLVLFAYQPPELISTGEDLARLSVNTTLNGWTIESDLSLPENAFKMVDLHPLNLPFGRTSMPGFIALYEIQETLQLIFTSTIKISSNYYKVSLTCPPGARSLSSFINTDGFTDLLVGGSGLYHFQAKKCLIKNSEGNRVSGSGVFSSARQLHTTQSQTQLSIWATSTADGIGYLKADTTFEHTEAPVQVIPDSEGGEFSAFKPTSSGPEEFIVANDKGVLTLLQQDSVSGLWKTVPFYTPALETTVDIPSYTTQITIRDSDKMPLVNSEVLLKSSGLVSIIANGRPIITDPIGVPVSTDQYGLITLIIPTKDISSYTFTITGSNAEELDGKSFPVDPTVKVNEILDKIHSGSDLTNVTLPSGEKLLAGTTLSSEEIETAAKAIEAVQSARITALQNNPTQSGSLDAVVQQTPPAPRPAALIGFHTDIITQHKTSIIDMPWDAWHWLESLVEKIVTWSIQKLQEGTAFIVQVGQQVYRWVLNGLTEIGKALSWILNKVLEIGEKLIEWLGFIFNWGDIQATQRSIVHLTNDALTSGLSYIGTLGDKVDTFFDGIINQLQDSSEQARPEEIEKAVANGDTGQPTQDDSNSAKANWAQYQFSHGGGVDASVIHGEEGGSDPLEVLWTEVIKPLFDTLRDSVEDLARIISRLFFFGNNKSLSVQEATAEIKTELLVDFVNGIRKVAVGLIKVAQSLINDFKRVINYTITIPVFSALYKKFISGGTDLTFLGGLAFIIAIPVTIITKVITGKAPPDMTNVNYGQIIDGKVTDDQQLLDFNHFNSVSSLVGNGLDGLISIISMEIGGVTMAETRSTPQGDIVLVSRANRANMMILTTTSAKELAKKSWKDVLGVVSRVASIPTDPNQPAYELRWISWVLSCINTGIAIALRRVTSAASVAIEKALAVIEGVLAAINYALIVAIKTIEFQTASFPGKDNTYTLLKIVSGTFDLLGTLSSDVGHLASDPETKGWAGVCSLAAQALSYNIEGAIQAVKLIQGDYNHILAKVM